MAMSRKDFKQLAEIIKRLRRRDVDKMGDGSRINTQELIDELCYFCNVRNTNFDTQRFKDACEA